MRSEQDDVRAYLDDIKREPALLTAEEEAALMGRVAEGDAGARDEMARRNLRLVVSIANRYARRGLPLVDLIEEGNIGLLKAIEKFDLKRKCRFSTYATFWIKQVIRRTLSDKVRAISAPAYLMGTIRRWKAAAEEILQSEGRPATPEELGERLGLSRGQVARVRQALLTDKPSEVMEATPDLAAPEGVGGGGDLDSLRLAMRFALTQREEAILARRFGLGGKGREKETLERVGASIGLTRERIRQVEMKARNKLRLFMEQREEYVQRQAEKA